MNSRIAMAAILMTAALTGILSTTIKAAYAQRILTPGLGDIPTVEELISDLPTPDLDRFDLKDIREIVRVSCYVTDDAFWCNEIDFLN
jgi:hypothetical protein